MRSQPKGAARGIDRRPPREIGDENRAMVRKFFETHLCATRRECAAATGLGVEAVGRHVKHIRAEWKPKRARKT